MNKAVIFDLDGTILDSAPDILYNLNLMLDEFGHKRIDLQRVYDTIGHGARNLVKGAIDEALSDEEIDARLSFYNQKYTSSGSPYTKLFGLLRCIREYHTAQESREFEQRYLDALLE